MSGCKLLICARGWVLPVLSWGWPGPGALGQGNMVCSGLPGSLFLAEPVSCTWFSVANESSGLSCVLRRFGG